MWTLLGKILNGFPYLLYLADAQLGLVEQDEVLIQVLVAIEYIAFGIEVWISSCTSSLLYIVLQRVGDVVMDNKTHIALIYSHTEGGGGDDDSNLIAHEGILIVYLLIGIHLAIIGQGGYAVTGQFLGEFPGSLGAGYVDDGRAISLLYQRAQEIVFVAVTIYVDNGIVQVGT